LAVISHQYESTKLLLELGADINLPDRVGDTPLHLAIRNHLEDFVDLFIISNVDLTIQNKKKETPFELAQKNFNNIDFDKFLNKK